MGVEADQTPRAEAAGSERPPKTEPYWWFMDVGGKPVMGFRRRGSRHPEIEGPMWWCFEGAEKWTRTPMGAETKERA